MGTESREHAAGEAVLSPGRTWIVATALLVATLATVIWSFVLGDGPLVDLIAVGVWITITAAVAWLVAVRRPGNPCGWLLGAAAFLASLGMSSLEVAQARIGAGGEGISVEVAAWLGAWLTVPGFASFIFLLLRFPSGELPSSRWRWVERMALAGTALATVSVAFDPGPLEATPSLDNPFGVAALEPALTVIENVGAPLLAASGITAVFSLIARYRRAGTTRREQLKWIAYSTIFLVLTGMLAGAVESAGALNEASFYLVVLGLSALPASIGIAILRHRLFDIDLLINRTIVYTAMTIGVIGFYVAIVGSLTGVIGSRVSLGASLIATAVVAIAFNPVREGLQALVNRLMYGQRDDPYSVLAGLAQRLEEVEAREAVLPAVVEGLADSLRLPYVAIRIHGGEGDGAVFEHGKPGERTVSLSMSHHAEEVGELIVSPRSGEDSIGPADRDLLTDLARQIGPAARAVRLADDLQRSRASIVRAREEERRRLRRDLHDGLGPELAGISLGIGAAARMVDTDVDALKELMSKLDTQLKEAISNVRTIVAGLVPPELERLGLVGAVQERSATFSTSGDLEVGVSASELPPLPAAVEVAAYRIVLEALANVAKHSGASRCSVTLWVEDGLKLEIADDGRGVPPDHATGTGLVSMRERAEELGGTLSMSSGATGTRLVAHLPIVMP